MVEVNEDSLIQMLNEEREKLLKEVQELVEKRKKLMAGDEVKEYNFYKRRTIANNW